MVIASRDGMYVFYSGLKLLARNLKSVPRTFSEVILATNRDGTIAIGNKSIFDGTTFAVKRLLPLGTSIMVLGVDDTTLYLYDTMSSNIDVYRLSP